MSAAAFSEHFEELFSWPIVTADLPIMTSSESMQVDTGSSSEMEIIREIRFLKQHRMLGQDGLATSFLNESYDVLTLK